METRANYALIGAFVLIAAFAVAGFVMWLGQAQFRQDFKAYDIVFEGPVSLEEGSAVRYIGIKVGEVSTVRIDRADTSKVRARIRIDRETPVRKDSTASIQLAGITGTTFIQITAGTGDPLEARAGEPVPVIKAERTQLDELFSGGTEVLGNAAQDNGLADKASATLDDVSNATRKFEGASASFETLSNNTNTRVAELADQLDLVVSDVRSITKTANETIEQSNRAVSAAADAIEGPATSAIEDARLASQDLRVLINRLDRVAREIERNPQSFVAGDPIPYEGER